MKIKNLIRILENFDGDMDVKIGMNQDFGTDYAYDIGDIDMHDIHKFYGDDIESVVITIGSQVGVVDYDKNNL